MCIDACVDINIVDEADKDTRSGIIHSLLLIHLLASKKGSHKEIEKVLIQIFQGIHNSNT